MKILLYLFWKLIIYLYFCFLKYNFLCYVFYYSRFLIPLFHSFFLPRRSFRDLFSIVLWIYFQTNNKYLSIMTLIASYIIPNCTLHSKWFKKTYFYADPSWNTFEEEEKRWLKCFEQLRKWTIGKLNSIAFAWAKWVVKFRHFL